MRTASVGQGHQSAIGRSELVRAHSEGPGKRTGDVDEETAGRTRFRSCFRHRSSGSELPTVPTLSSAITAIDREHPRAGETGLPACHAADVIAIDDRIEFVVSGGTGGESLIVGLGRQDIPHTEITGADALSEILGWERTDEVLALAHLVGVTRPGHALVDPGLSPGRVTLIEVPALAISSSDVRRRVAAGAPISYLVPAGVESYIDKRGLYREGPGS